MVLFSLVFGVSEINTLCNGNSNDKSCSSSYSEVFSADVKDSSFKNAELILLEDGGFA